METVLKIDSLAFGGRAVGTLENGKRCFVRGGVPGDVLKINVVSDRKKFAVGEIVEIQTPSPDRIKPACPYFGQCPGCSYLNIGPMFPTRTKSVACGALGLEKIEELKSLVTCPFSVMGGIKEHHLPLLCSKGFKHIAMVTEITQAPDVETKVKQLRRIMAG